MPLQLKTTPHAKSFDPFPNEPYTIINPIKQLLYRIKKNPQHLYNPKLPTPYILPSLLHCIKNHHYIPKPALNAIRQHLHQIRILRQTAPKSVQFSASSIKFTVTSDHWQVMDLEKFELQRGVVMMDDFRIEGWPGEWKWGVVYDGEEGLVLLSDEQYDFFTRDGV
ncbi:hypothetical protein HDV00_011669 [Rhizophlyctis rosea]|nr:hypothetical protein HDV00_011669 [Rhizophlyctis rosea]